MSHHNYFPENNKLFFLGIFIAIIVMALDLYTKNLIFSFLDNLYIEQNLDNPQLQITSFFNLVKVWNSGISFGMLNDLENGKYIILSINCIILLILIFWLYHNNSLYLTWAIGLIVGGAIGNMIDRANNSAVADFLDFHIKNYHWPAFNIADSCIFIGVFLLLFENYFTNKSKENKSKNKPLKNEK